ncbi:hypothetical protein NO2_0407 [Candidatus Termititenax persephonae]|uniref:Uncharacterized protein n=1 Tax=Candidatus Termititenax persephonae TaxID=2218525 RepID=A0A388TFW9_9BACT|nr:hypothetical protein NO2_0407 [Candidatus Termititenax persephonae]
MQEDFLIVGAGLIVVVSAVISAVFQVRYFNECYLYYKKLNEKLDKEQD